MGVARALAVATLVWSVSGCVESTSQECAGALTCPVGTLCDDAHGTCADPGQFTACDGRTDGDACQHRDVDGVCDQGVCVTATCGDGYVSITEACDDGNAVGGDGCSADCLSSEVCGNGVIDAELGEQCDCGAVEPADDCVSLNSDAPGASCRENCTPHCGDGLVNTAEECDTVPPAGGCLGFGFDRGRLDCSSACGVAFADCASFGFESLGGPGLVGVLPNSIWVADTGEIFVVGGNFVGMYDGTSWHVEPAFQLHNWTAVSGLSKDFVVAFAHVAQFEQPGPAALMWNGTEWTSFTPPFLPILDFSINFDVLAIAPDDLISATTTVRLSSGLIIGAAMQYDGTEWTPAIGAAGSIIRAAARVGDTTDAVVVGTNGAVLRRTAGEWTSETVGDGTAAFTDVWAPAADDVYVASEQGDVFHYDGTDWQTMTMPTAERFSLLGIAGVSADDIYAVGEGGRVLHYDGTGWFPLRANLGSDDINAISSDGGTLHVATTAFSVHRTSGGSWGELAVGGVSTSTAVSVAGDVVFASFGSDAVRYDGTSVRSLGGFNSISALAAVGPDDVVIAGFSSGTELVHADGLTVTRSVLSAAAGDAIAVVSPAHIYLVSFHSVVEVVDGVTTTHPISLDLVDAFVDIAADADAAYAITRRGQIWTNASGSWELELETGDALTTLWMAPDGTMFAGGEVGSLWRHDGGQWLPQTIETDERIIDLSGSAASDVFATTFSGLHHYDGEVWAPVNNLDIALDDVAVTTGDVFFTSRTGSLHRLERPTPW